MGLLSSIGKGVKSVVGGVDDALGGYGGDIIGGVASAYGAYQQQQFSKGEAKKQRKFQERMSSTAHQRQVEDLKKAGLNPILSANSGASSPGGAMGTGQNIGKAGVEGKIATARNIQELKNMKEVEKLTKTQEAKAMAERAILSQQYNIKEAEEQYMAQLRDFYKENPSWAAANEWAQILMKGTSSASNLAATVGRLGKRTPKTYRPGVR